MAYNGFAIDQYLDAAAVTRHLVHPPGPAGGVHGGLL